MHGHIANPQVKSGGTEQQIKVTKWIKVTEVGTAISDALIIGGPQGLSATERVAHGLTEQVGKHDTKEPIPDQIKKLPRLLFHRINQS